MDAPASPPALERMRMMSILMSIRISHIFWIWQGVALIGALMNLDLFLAVYSETLEQIRANR